MKINSILNRYILKELLPTFFLSTGFFTFIFLMTQILDITDMIVNYNVKITDVLLMILYMIPQFLDLVIPISIMISILLNFMKLSSDNEIIALKSCGMSLYALIPPVLMFCFFGYLIASFMTIYGQPWGRVAFKTLGYQLIANNLEIGLKEQTFHDQFKGLTLYINKIDKKNKTLEQVFIEDHRIAQAATTIIAPKGRMIQDLEKYIFQLQLYNGIINQVNMQKKSVNSTQFDTYTMQLDMQKKLPSFNKKKKHRKEMNLEELRYFLDNETVKDANYYYYMLEYYYRFSIPFSCFTLGFFALPAGALSSNNRKRSSGIGLGILCVLLYYLLLSAGKVSGETNAIPPIIGMWFPNIVIGCIGIFMMNLVAKERSGTIEFVEQVFYRMKCVFKK